MKISTRRFASVVAALSLMVTAKAWSQVDASRRNPLGENRDLWAWTKEPWMGREGTYRHIRLSTDQAFRKKLSRARLQQYARYERQAQGKPSDAQAQFRWAYAAFNAALRMPSGSREQQMTFGLVSNALARPKSPRAYEYARLRFLVTAAISPDTRLKTVGRRLVSRNPKDYDVKYLLTDILDPGSNPAEKREALSYAQDLFHLDARRSTPGVHAVIGSIYWRSWRRTKTQEDADNAIAAYQRFLQLAPSNHYYRKGAERMISSIQRAQG